MDCTNNGINRDSTAQADAGHAAADERWRIGFIGLGTMGLPMVRRICEAGYAVTVWGRREQAVRQAVSFGAVPAASVSALAAQCDVVLLMVSDDAAARALVCADDGLTAPGAQVRMVVNCTTVSPDTSRALAAHLAGRGVGFVEAPVTGSRPQAEDGTLNFLVGGRAEDVARLQPLLRTMGKNVFHLGEVGRASAAKLASNAIVAMNLASLLEGLAIARRAGLDAELFTHILQQGGARSAVLDAKRRKLLDRDFDPQFAVKWMWKDIRLALALADAMDLPLTVLPQAAGLFRRAVQEGWGDEDVAAVMRCYDTLEQT
ncbi:MAG: NAD(P)-dependent oxidoreductase [Alicyclobacillaceae bacterium]|nr:NAD(P)-dependent oxidoreductase [Alicyclobacillaceae bacterium]